MTFTCIVKSCAYMYEPIEHILPPSPLDFSPPPHITTRCLLRCTHPTTRHHHGRRGHRGRARGIISTTMTDVHRPGGLETPG